MSKSFSSSLISIEKNDKEILNTIVTNVIKMITTLQTSFANLDIKINACIDLLTPEAMIFIKKRNPAEMEVDGDAAMEAQVKPSVHGGYARGWGPDGFDPKRYGTP